MTGCHNCQHAVAIAAGKYANVDWKETPCASCDVMRGADYPLPFDENHPEAEAAAAAGAAEPLTADDCLPVKVFSELVVAFLKMTPEMRDVVAWRFAGMRYDEIALVQGVTPQCAERRHCRALKQWPVLAELFPVKARKCANRKRHNRRRAG